ncbi:hypothetical protein [Bradyrhizobium sp. NP1]|nr:hypothetical protein [Bradyrhizobium sp. NP1]WJR78678.1 hypothetical protein QOU61_02350 [Bradyrhizobium sp. NP1]
MKRPETTNLNHQYAIRRMFIARPSKLTGPAVPIHSAAATNPL